MKRETGNTRETNKNTLRTSQCSNGRSFEPTLVDGDRPPDDHHLGHRGLGLNAPRVGLEKSTRVRHALRPTARGGNGSSCCGKTYDPRRRRRLAFLKATSFSPPPTTTKTVNGQDPPDPSLVPQDNDGGVLPFSADATEPLQSHRQHRSPGAIWPWWSFARPGAIVVNKNKKTATTDTAVGRRSTAK